MGSDGVQTTYDGCNTGYIPIPCSGFFGTYSTEFLAQVWKDGELLKQANTQADYGVVSVAGSCG